MEFKLSKKEKQSVKKTIINEYQILMDNSHRNR